MAFVPVGDLVDRAAERLESPSQSALLNIKKVWPFVVENLSLQDGIEPKKFTKGVLFLKCRTLSDADQLKLKKETIRKKLNSKLASDRRVRVINFKPEYKYGRSQ